MDKYTVKFDTRVRNQLASVARYLAGVADPNRASSFVRNLTNEAKSLNTFPYRGQSKDHIYPGLHIIGYKRRATIAYFIDDADKIVSIAGIFMAVRTGNQSYARYYPSKQLAPIKPQRVLHRRYISR